MNNVNVTIQLCEEDRKRIDELIRFAGLIVGEMKSGNAPEPAAVPDPAPAAAEHPAEATTAPFDPPATAPVSLGEFQKALVTRCAESVETKQKVQALVQKYADSVSNIPEDKRPEVLSALAQI